ncbi:MAG: ATP-dependent DNA ligase [Actinomycetota bacterium]
MLIEELVATSEKVAQTSSRKAKVEHLGSLLAQLSPDEVRIAVVYLSGELPHDPIGVGWAGLRALPAPADRPSLEILEVDAAFRRIGAITGPGSQAARRTEVDLLFGRATKPEQEFLARLLMGELRQGALKGVMTDAIARAAGVPLTAVRRAAMLSGDLGEVALATVAEGTSGLDAFKLDVLRPLEPMLAQSAPDMAAALERISPAAIEWKLDGVRVQVHRREDEVRIFTRNLADVTDRLPEVVTLTRALPLRSAVLDGETIALEPDGRPQSFQVTGSRFASRLDVATLSERVPLSFFVFDVLHLDGEDFIDRSHRARAEALQRVAPELIVPRMVTGKLGEAERFLEEALTRGHEGVMVKALDAPYEAGRRGTGWIKVKRAHTLDLVVLAAEWGHGRRRGKLSNLHLGARDPDRGEFVMLGKTFKGLTDEMLVWQTDRLQQLETEHDGITVYVRPELVVEIAFDGLQVSSRYPAALALRFARVKGYRLDKRPDEADTVETVRAIHAGELAPRRR